jgi:hypothetical protein
MSDIPYLYSLDGTLQQAFILAAREPESDVAALLRNSIRAIVTYQAQNGDDYFSS